MGDFIFTNNCFYILTNTEKSKLIKKVKKSITNEDSQFIIITIDNINMSYQPLSIQSWIKDKLFKEEVKKYESDNQEILKRYNYIIDAVQQDLENQIRNGVTNQSDNSQE